MTRKLMWGTLVVAGMGWMASCSPPASGTRPGGQNLPAASEQGQQAESTVSAEGGTASEARPGEPDRVTPAGGRSAKGPGGGRGPRWQRGRAGVAVELTAGERASIGLRTAVIARGPARTELKAMGRLAAPQNRMAVISYPFSARVAAVRVQVGDWVKQGQPLVTLQSEAVGAARAEYSTALADLQLAERAFERESALVKGGVGAQKNYQTSEAALKVAQTRLEAAEKKLHLLGFTEAQVAALRQAHDISPVISLHAPIDGKVVVNQAVLGAVVNESTEILTIVNPTVLWMDAEIYERDLAKIRVGQAVYIVVPAYPGERFAGRVGYVGDVVKEGTQTITVRAEVANRDARLKPGMFASASFVLAEADRAIVVPESAVLDDSGSAMVFVVAGSRFVPRSVRIGARTDGYFEVLEGLSEGEEVVTQGAFQLRSKLFEAVLRAGVH